MEWGLIIVVVLLVIIVILLGIIVFILNFSDSQNAMKYEKQSAKQKEHWDTIEHRLKNMHFIIGQINTEVEKVNRTVIDAILKK